jgi:hypothetical protein
VNGRFRMGRLQIELVREVVDLSGRRTGRRYGLYMGSGYNGVVVTENEVTDGRDGGWRDVG